ncbi:hypothetical protein TVAG_287450 [Trichomonas vaginalis G3]|uniref:Uncharacterized protein n=1 Tax=Trichomonas vaginalis (strain ATCC PRA-98 / G3) TaxID=412133 RepID=A2FKE4_TRIV3|nr:hypothetical protein TVAGG3_0246890 [Trichomonas vaginalis G3]EAX94610.1 hypothetical protein TVAG_287450 [Trichomonas vaginalis G3]KAI5553720.1 hypothetical protein TVAGG3_0246890 [Trichomonas vaginalis G3]|eukprot:XP_001307540.1 hypothetical protein [Trichomonas vaginalis G3]
MDIGIYPPDIVKQIVSHQTVDGRLHYITNIDEIKELCELPSEDVNEMGLRKVESYWKTVNNPLPFPKGDITSFDIIDFEIIGNNPYFLVKLYGYFEVKLHFLTKEQVLCLEGGFSKINEYYQNILIQNNKSKAD